MFYQQVVIHPAQVFDQMPLHKCWQLKTGYGEDSIASIASDNGGSIFALSSNGNVQSLDSSSGTINWRSDIGGQFLDINLSDKSKLYLLSKESQGEKSESGKKDDSNDDPMLEIGVDVTALNKETGVTKWHTSLRIEATGGVHLLGDQEALYVLTNLGEFFVLDIDNGNIQLHKRLYKKLTSMPKLTGQQILFGTSDRKVIGISKLDSVIKTVLQTEFLPVEVLIKNDKYLFLGDELGNVVLVNRDTGKIEWKMRTGAQISNMTLTERGLLLSSFDNYIYLLSERNGKRLWRRRLLGRSVGEFASKEGLAVFSILNGSDVIFIQEDKGKVVNQLTVPDGDFFLSNPLWVNNLLVFHTYKGLSAYGSERDCHKK